MVSVPTKSSLTPARRRLVERLQQLNFGRIEGLLVRGGEPVFGPSTRIERVTAPRADQPAARPSEEVCA
jgi:hypothetical protein